MEIVSSNRTQSFVGKIGGKQTLELAGWANAGNIAHELGHALGLFHEQMRSDRDQWLVIDPSCLDNKNYRKAVSFDKGAKDLGPYNMYSIMHYSLGLNCFKLKVTNFPAGIPGQRDSITLGDQRAINAIYGF